MSQRLLTESLAASTSDVLVYLFTITHKKLSQPILISSDQTELYDYDVDTGIPRYCTRSQGKVFLYVPFSYVQASIADNGSITPAKFIIGNVDPVMSQTLLEMEESATIKCQMVYAAEPGKILDESVELRLMRTEDDIVQITCSLTMDTALTEALPALRMTPATFPGAFKP